MEDAREYLEMTRAKMKKVRRMEESLAEHVTKAETVTGVKIAEKVQTSNKATIDATLAAIEEEKKRLEEAQKELEDMLVNQMQAAYRNYSRKHVYDYRAHVALAEKLDKEGHLPASFMVVAPGSWDENVWDDINRMRTLNTQQRLKRKQMHLCPLQIDVVERLVDRYSNEGETILDPFGTVPLVAMKKNRKGIGIELNEDYFTDGVNYLEMEEEKQKTPTLFDYIPASSH